MIKPEVHKRHRLFLACILLVFSPIAAIGAPLRIMPLGDSLTAGGYNENGMYQIGGGYRVKLDSLLKQSGLDFVFVGSLENGPGGFPNRAHEGHTGFRIDQLQGGVKAWLASAQPDLILLMIGTNDILQNDDVDQAPSRFESLLDTIEAALPSAQIIVSATIPTENEDWNLLVQNYNQAISAISNRHDHVFIDMYDDAGLVHDRTDLIDGVHPNPSAYEKLAPVWADGILESNRCLKYRQFLSIFSF
jgi:acyl-CoA thioesterase-1